MPVDMTAVINCISAGLWKLPLHESSAAGNPAAAAGAAAAGQTWEARVS